MSDVFISYSRLDKEFVSKLREALVSKTQNVWIDWESIPESQAWWGEIQKGIARANNFVVVLSPNSMASPICQMEIEYARLLKKRLIPVVYADYDREESLISITKRLATKEQAVTREIWGSRQPHEIYDANVSDLSHFNYFFFKADVDFQKRFDELLVIIRADYAHKEQHTTLELRAQEWDRRGQDASFLLIYNELVQAQRWLTGSVGKEPPPTNLHREYIAASEKRTRQLRSIRWASIIGTVIAVVAIIFAIIAYSIGLNATTQAQSANTQVANANATLTPIPITLAFANASINNANQKAAAANTQVANANATLTPIPVTLAAISTQIQNGQNTIESQRLAGLADQILSKTGGNAEASALLAIRGLKTAYTTQADAALVQAMSQLSTKQIFADYAPVIKAAISPNGKIVMTGNQDDGAVMLWSVAFGQTLGVLTTIDGLSAIAFSPDGNNIFTGSNIGLDPKAQLWDVTTRKLLKSYNFDSVSDAVFSPDGKTILTCGCSDTGGSIAARLWDLASGRLIRSFEPSGGVDSIAFSPDGKLILTGGSLDHAAHLWDVNSGLMIQTFMPPDDTSSMLAGIDTTWITSVVFSPDGNSVLIGGGNGDNTAWLWDIRRNLLLTKFSGHTDSIKSMAFSPDGKTIVTGSADFTARLWRVTDGRLLRIFTGHTLDVNSVAFSADGKEVLTASRDSTARLWSVSDDNLQATDDLRPHMFYTGGSVKSIAFSPDGKLVATGEDSFFVPLWDTANGQLIRVIHAPHTTTALAFSPNGKTILTGQSDNAARLWDVNTGQLIQTLSGSDGILSVVFSPDGRNALTGGYGNVARLWSLSTGQTLQSFSGHTNGITSVAFSPDGHTILTGSDDNTARLWDIATGQTIHTFTGHTSEVSSVAFSPDGKTILTGSFDGTARLWDISTGHTLRVFSGDMVGIYSVAISPNGSLILTGDYNKTAQLWAVTSGQLLRTYTGHTNPIYTVAFSPDGKTVATGSEDWTAGLWNTDYRDFIKYACAKVFRDLTGNERSQFNIADSGPTCPQFQSKSNPLTAPMPPTTTTIPDLTLPVWTPIASPTASDTPTNAPTAVPYPSATYPGILLTFTPSARDITVTATLTPTS